MLFPYAFILTFTSSGSAHKNVYIDNKNKSIGEFRRWSYRSYYSFDIKEKYYNNLRDIHCLEEVRYSLIFSRFLYQSPIFVVIKKKRKHSWFWCFHFSNILSRYCSKTFLSRFFCWHCEKIFLKLQPLFVYLVILPFKGWH